jgi:hypothetical protein
MCCRACQVLIAPKRKLLHCGLLLRKCLLAPPQSLGSQHEYSKGGNWAKGQLQESPLELLESCCVLGPPLCCQCGDAGEEVIHTLQSHTLQSLSLLLVRNKPQVAQGICWWMASGWQMRLRTVKPPSHTRGKLRKALPTHRKLSLGSVLCHHRLQSIVKARCLQGHPLSQQLKLSLHQQSKQLPA